MPNLWVIFLTGLLTGGLTCMAVQGGLLTALIAQRQVAGGNDKRSNALAILLFLTAKLIAYTLLGVLLGWLGSFFQITPFYQGALMVGISIYMVGVGLNMLNVHPIFRYFVLQPPRFITKLVRNQSKQTDLLAPASLGAMTVFIPCGTTQAMMALAVGTANPVYGALVLASFVIGTSPLFFVLGYGVTALKDVLKDRFATVASWSVIVMALWNMNNGFVLTGSPVTFSGAIRAVYCTVSFCSEGTVASAQTPTDHPTITIQSRGYSVDNSVLKAGSRVTLSLVNSGGSGCVQAFTIPKLGIQKVVPPGTTDSVEFTVPNQAGELAFTCSMGMYSGKFQIVEGT